METRAKTRGCVAQSPTPAPPSDLINAAAAPIDTASTESTFASTPATSVMTLAAAPYGEAPAALAPPPAILLRIPPASSGVQPNWTPAPSGPTTSTPPTVQYDHTKIVDDLGQFYHHIGNPHFIPTTANGIQPDNWTPAPSGPITLAPPAVQNFHTTTVGDLGRFYHHSGDTPAGQRIIPTPHFWVRGTQTDAMPAADCRPIIPAPPPSMIKRFPDATRASSWVQHNDWTPAPAGPTTLASPAVSPIQVTRAGHSIMQTPASCKNQQPAANAWRPSPMFAGETLECPEAFLRLVEQLPVMDEGYVTNYVLSNCLTGDAAKWAKRLAIDEETPWSTFSWMLTATYNAEPVLRQLEARLHGEVQQSNEPAVAFINKKHKIIRRLGVPVTPELIRRLVFQLRHDLRPHLLHSRIDCISDLQQAAFDLELQLAPLEVKQPKSGIQRHEQPAQLPRHQTPPERTNPFTSDRQPPSACRFCSGAHWHRDCPQRIAQGNC